MVQGLTSGERALLPEGQWVPEGPVLQDDPEVPAMKNRCPHELVQPPVLSTRGCVGVGGTCNGYNLRSTEATPLKP